MTDINTMPAVLSERPSELDGDFFAKTIANMMAGIARVEPGESSPTSPALPAAGALRGDVPLSRTEGTEV